jgi:hypothetical protein
MKLEFEFKTGFSRIRAEIETTNNFEDVVKSIWESELVHLVGAKSQSFRVEDLMWISEITGE